MIIPIEAMLHDAAPDEPQMIMELVTGDEPVIIEIGSGEVGARTASGSADRGGVAPHLVVSGPPKAILGVLSGKLPLKAATQLGVRLEGDHAVLERVGLTGAAS